VASIFFSVAFFLIVAQPLQNDNRLSDSGRPVRNLRCPNCQTELKVNDVSADPFGEVVVGYNTCSLQILTESRDYLRDARCAA
jgi:hypothetical protein